MNIEDIIKGCKILNDYYCKDGDEFSRYDRSWDLMMPIVDLINSQGKEYNFIIFKNYIALTVEKDSKFFKDFRFAHSENITSEQTGKEACFKLLIKYTLWETAKKG